MRILVSNDDGYLAPGLICLVQSLRERGADVTVVAPDRNRSGASNSLTLEYPLRAKTAENGFVYVDGTPTDCVHLAITGLLKEVPDIVISGINMGANMGDDVLYSGTVAAAMEGRSLGLPAIAVSLTGYPGKHYLTAARIVNHLLDRLQQQRLELPPSTILNLNVPDLPWEEVKGIETTRLGQRHRAAPVIKQYDPREQPIYWIGPPGEEQDGGPGTDFYAIRNGYASLTPIHVDLTSYKGLDVAKQWLNDLSL